MHWSNYDELKGSIIPLTPKGSIIKNSEGKRSVSNSLERKSNKVFNKKLVKPPIINYSDLSKQIISEENDSKTNTQRKKGKTNEKETSRKSYTRAIPVKD